ncbi:hypothetical protein ASPZODRAFT_121619 [Penicilliopsis zonata CBS 506.65]|uniref:Ribosomal protein S15 n=1 Tax=Penicilliopsis zonata CBS 506.65 TaxID=1073090 RepID=A0A1L9SB06_9EURO|nr:hypothetical protein ASPZODRAFT_121619 [Penicilliopsis zonata CBS 506.65]OJJ44338.1 hypothetical protein ASPZODRAFT_121619 [Penicilliopsis zonata CBS 506.65]
MTPRIALQPAFKAFTGSSFVQNPLVALALNPSKTSVRAGSAESRERRRHDPFLQSLARRRKAANSSRQQVLREERKVALGDPVESKPTPFIQEIMSLQTQGPVQGKSRNINFYVSPDELDAALEFSKNITFPHGALDRDLADPQLEKEAAERHLQEHRNAEEAVNRIVNLSNGDSQDRMHLITQKCIETFGRHNTDGSLPPNPVALPKTKTNLEKNPRVGLDCGSSEVQIAILTAKILNLSKHLQTAKRDKHNRRNLRLLVHKRQGLLQYLRKKERGGPRWLNLMETLGLSDAAWKGEITIR